MLLRSSEMKIWNLPLNLAAVEVIGDFEKNSVIGGGAQRAGMK